MLLYSDTEVDIGVCWQNHMQRGPAAQGGSPFTEPRSTPSMTAFTAQQRQHSPSGLGPWSPRQGSRMHSKRGWMRQGEAGSPGSLIAAGTSHLIDMFSLPNVADRRCCGRSTPTCCSFTMRPLRLAWATLFTVRNILCFLAGILAGIFGRLSRTPSKTPSVCHWLAFDQRAFGH